MTTRNLTLGENPISDINPFSDEHIVPSFIGGALKFKRVCKTCNSRMGTGFEGRLSKSFLFLSFAHDNGISVQSPFYGTYSDEVNRIKYRVNNDHSVQLFPKFSSELNGNTLRIKAEIGSADIDKWDSMLETTIIRKYSQVKFDSEKFKLDFSKRVVRPILCKDFDFCFGDFLLLLLKFVYELAVYHFEYFFKEDNVLSDIRKTLHNCALKVDEELVENISFLSFEKINFFENRIDDENHWVIFYDKFCYVKTGMIPELPVFLQIVSQPIPIDKIKLMLVNRFNFKEKIFESFWV